MMLRVRRGQLGVHVAQEPSHVPADTVLDNAYVYTVGRPRLARAVAIRDGRIAFVGGSRNVRAHIGPETHVIDAEGHMVLPGFVSSHAYARSVMSDIFGAVSLYAVSGGRDEYLAAIRRVADTRPGASVIQGVGFDTRIADDRGPRKEWLDNVSTKRPIVVLASCGTCAWCNSAALAAAGIDGETPDPEGGRIERLVGTAGPSGHFGEPAGTLRGAAIGLLGERFTDYTVEEHEEGARRLAAQAVRNGVTGLHGLRAEVGFNGLAAMENLAVRAELPVWVRVRLHLDPGDDLPEFVTAAGKCRARCRTRFFQVDQAELDVDGDVRDRAAWLLEPYAHAGSRSCCDLPWAGAPVWPSAALRKALAELDAAGFQVEFNASGDRAVREALNAIRYARRVNGALSNRCHSVAQLAMAARRDVSRFVRIGAVAHVRPSFMVHDEYIEDCMTALGSARAGLMYPLRSLFDGGAEVCSGADGWALDEVNPLRCAQLGVMRWYPPAICGDRPRMALHPMEERASIEQMIRSLTLGGAVLCGVDAMRGSIEVGKYADLVVLERNLITCDPAEIGFDNKVLMTLFEGREVYRDSDW